MKTVAGALLFFSLFMQIEISSAASSEDCNFYLNFVNHPKCSTNDNYLLQYGYKYCSEFLKNRRQNTRWSNELKEWATNTSVCLQEMIELNSKRLRPTCDQMTEYAFDTHPICYKQYGVCKLGRADQIRIVKMVSLVDLYSNFRNSVVQVFNTGLRCLSYETAISDLANAFFYRVLNSKSGWKGDEFDAVKAVIDLIPEDGKEAREFFQHLAPHFLFNAPVTNMGEALKYYSSAYESDKYDTAAVLQNGVKGPGPFSKQAYVYKTFKMAPKDAPMLKQANEAYTENLTRKQLLNTLEAAKAFTGQKQ